MKNKIKRINNFRLIKYKLKCILRKNMKTCDNIYEKLILVIELVIDTTEMKLT